MILNKEFCPDVVVAIVAFVVVVVITGSLPLTKSPLDLFHCSLVKNKVKSVLFTIKCMPMKSRFKKNTSKLIKKNIFIITTDNTKDK